MNSTSTTVTASAGVREPLYRWSYYSALSALFFIPISPALMNISLSFTLLFVLASGNTREHFQNAWKNPVSKAALLLFLLFTAGVFWSTAPLTESLEGLKKYNELWYVALLTPLFSSDHRRHAAINTFMLSMTTILTLAYLLHTEIVSSIQYPSFTSEPKSFSVDGGFRSHIITNILMAFATYTFAQKLFLTVGTKKSIYLALFILSAYYSLFISTGTTGQILSISFIALLLIQYTGWKAVITIPLALVLITSYGYMSKNTSFNHAVNKIKGGIEHDGGSASQRREFANNSIYLIQQSPWIGYGTGSINTTYKTLPTDKIRTRTTSNPHNEYIAITLQLGLIGLLSLLSLFFTQFRASLLIKEQEQKYLAQGLIVLVTIACLGNSILMDSGEGHFWAFLTAILFSSLAEKKPVL